MRNDLYVPLIEFFFAFEFVAQMTTNETHDNNHTIGLRMFGPQLRDALNEAIQTTKGEVYVNVEQFRSYSNHNIHKYRLNNSGLVGLISKRISSSTSEQRINTIKILNKQNILK